MPYGVYLFISSQFDGENFHTLLFPARKRKPSKIFIQETIQFDGLIFYAARCEYSSASIKDEAVFIIALAVFMGSLDTTIVNIALPTISEAFHTDISVVSWVMMAYILIICSFLLIFGKIGDSLGFKKVFLAGFGVFTVGSLLCGLSGSINELIGFRVLQAIGGAALEAVGPAMVAVYLSKEIRGRILGLLATAASLGIAAGPVLGGLLTQYISWHWIFFVNIPVGIVAIFIGLRVIPADRPATRPKCRFDIPGAVLIFLSLTLLIYALNQGLYLGWSSPLIAGSLAGAVIFALLFLYQEKHCEDPLVDISLLKDLDFSLANTAGMLLMLVMNGSLFLLPFYLEGIKNTSTDVAGLFLAVPSVFLMILGPVAGAMADRRGSRLLCSVSALICAGAFLLFSGFSEDSSFIFVVSALALEGIAIGLFFPPNMTAILNRSPPDREGLASSIMMTMRNIGDVLGVALFGTIFVSIVMGSAHIPSGPAHINIPTELFVEGFQAAFMAGVIICVIAFVLSLATREGKAAG